MFRTKEIKVGLHKNNFSSAIMAGEFSPKTADNKNFFVILNKIFVKLIYSIKTNMMTSFFSKFLVKILRKVLGVLSGVLNRMQPTKRQPLMAIFSVIDGLVFIFFFFNIENFEQAGPNIQIWLRLLHNIMIHKYYFLELVRSSHWRCSVKKGVLRNFPKFTRKHLCQILSFNKVTGLSPATLLKKRLWHRCFL